MDQTEIMHRVIGLARRAMEGGYGYPFGTVIVRDGEILGEGHNEVLATRDPTAHAEVVAIRRACAKLGTHDLSGAEMYINGTPCCMCMGSMLWANIARAYYCLSEGDSESIGFGDRPFYDEVARPIDRRRIIPMIQLPELRAEAWSVFKDWDDRAKKG
jgi:tRNA(Arg) A34 adenosine deaminase TadA